MAGIRPGFLDGPARAPRPLNNDQWAGRLPRDAAPVLPANVFKRVIAPPGRGAHVRLEKALEGIVALMGRTNYDKDYPCNSTALRALVVCMHAGPSWGYPGDENQQAPLACDVLTIMEFLTERIAKGPKATPINNSTIITRCAPTPAPPHPPLRGKTVIRVCCTNARTTPQGLTRAPPPPGQVAAGAGDQGNDVLAPALPLGVDTPGVARHVALHRRQGKKKATKWRFCPAL